jgi:hypothetical protein
MSRTWKFVETLAMHIIAAIIVLSFVIYVTGTVRAHPSHNSCHKHGSVVHCK